MEASDQIHDPATLVLEKEILTPTGQEAGWALELVWKMWRNEKSLPPQELMSSPFPSYSIDLTISAS
jgi:hypothetical protein